VDQPRGLASRDKAWKLAQEAQSTADAKKRAKLEAKVRKEYTKAIRSFRSAIKADPRMHQAFSSLGYALRKTGQYEESLEAYNQALQLRPGYSEAIEYRAEALLGLNRLEEAKEAYMQLFRDDRERAEELMAAMQRWVEQRRVDPGGVDPSTLEEFSVWVRDRAEVSDNTASQQRNGDRTW
jgi:tetratricopeptide (TPR) repeat protein